MRLAITLSCDKSGRHNMLLVITVLPRECTCLMGRLACIVTVRLWRNNVNTQRTARLKGYTARPRSHKPPDHIIGNILVPNQQV